MGAILDILPPQNFELFKSGGNSFVRKGVWPRYRNGTGGFDILGGFIFIHNYD